MTSRSITAALLAVLLGGFSQAVKLDLYPDKALYRPGDSVTLVLEHSSPDRPRPIDLELKISRLNTELHHENRSLDLAKDGSLTFEWTPPEGEGAYGVDLVLRDADGKVAESTSTAFDVHSNWLDYPRYGFLSDFGPGEPDDGRVAELARYHVNALQFYDWMYRHDRHVPPTREFTDPLGRRLSLDVVERRISQAHALGMAAMPYTTIYGSSMGYYREHPEQALYRAVGIPWAFGNEFLMTMNPSPGSGWREHILAEYGRILDALPWDGLHIDQYGDPKTAVDHTGKTVHLADVIPGFLQDAKRVARSRRLAGRDAVIFNNVNDWPSETVAPSGVDAVYVEVWPPHDDYASLRDIIQENRRRSGGKPVILPAYLSPKADPATRLTDSVIAASGGTHLELGESLGILADPYFPKYERPAPPLAAWLRRYYDVITRYQHVLYDGRAIAVPDGIRLSGTRLSTGSYPKDAVWALASRGEDFEAAHLINLTASPTPHWRTAKDKPPVLHELGLEWPTARTVTAAYAVSPDYPTGSPRPLQFTQAAGQVRLTVPRLEYWTMIVLETR